MSTKEQLFVQIFERKRRIVEQVKHQTDLFDQHLASICLLEGISPPPWLFPSAHNELNKEDLISGLLLPKSQPAFPYSSTWYSLYQNTVITGDNTKLPDDLYVGNHASRNGFDAGNASSILPPCSSGDNGGAFEGVSELDLSVTSPQECRNPRNPDNQTLARLQRSKSRQKALEIRNSARAAESHTSDRNDLAACASRFAVSSINFLQSDQVDGSELVKPANMCNESCAVAEEKSGDCHNGEKFGSGSSVRITIAEEKAGDCRSKEKGSSSYSGRITRSRSSAQPPSVLIVSSELGGFSFVTKEGGTQTDSIRKTTQWPNSVNECMVNLSVDSDGSEGVRKVKTGTNQSKEKERSIYCGRITRSRSSTQPLYNVNVFPKLEGSSGIVKNDASAPPKSSDKLAQRAQSLSWSREEGETDFQNAQGHRLSAAMSLPSQMDSEVAASSREILEKCNSAKRGAAQNAGLRAGCSMQKMSDVIISGNSDHKVLLSRFAALKESQNENATQVPDERSLQDQNDVELRMVNEHLDKENNVANCTDRSTKTEMTCITEGKWRSVNSMPSTSGVKGSQSCASVKSPLTRSINNFERVDRESLGVQVNVLPGTEGIDNVDLEGYDAVAAETDAESDGSVKACSTSSGFDGHSSSHGAGLEDLVTRELCHCAMDVRPKQLDFDDVNMRETSSSAAEKKESPPTQERTLTLLHSVDIMDQFMSVHNQENCNSSLEIVLPEEEVLSKVEKAWRGSPEAHTGETDAVNRTASSNAGSVKETSAACTDAVTCTSQQSNQISEQQLLAIDCPTPELVVHEHSLQVPLEDANGSNLSTTIADTMMEFSFAKGIKSVSEDSVSEDTNLSTGACVGPKISEAGSLRNPDITLRGAFTEYPSAVLVDEVKCKSDKQKMYLGCSSDDKGVVSCKSSECLIVKKSILPGLSFNFDMEGSWSQHKRRKVEGLTGALSTSPSSQEGNVKQSDKSQFKIDQNMECHPAGEYESSSKLPVREEELNKEEKDRSAFTPFTSINDVEDLQAPFVSSLTKQTGGSGGSLVEKAEVAHPTSTLCNLKGQYTSELETIIELGNMESLTCGGRGMEESKSYPGENGKDSDGSTGSSHRQTMASAGADQSKPEFEGFIMQGNEHPFIAGEGINFEKLDLPKSVIERVSVLEQLCKSACMHTPLPHFSTPYKLHRTNLHQSVPNGLLECMDHRSSLPINDTFSGRPHSDCLPFSNTQSAWDTRKPYVSPIGKLWDRITSNSGSSEKRTSLNPDLPCISEENENLDDVADACQEGVGKELIAGSVKRETFADITENSNLPPSVSEVEICARSSLDSVNTEFSFTSTQNTIKQKLGNHKNNNRRQVNKGKENQTIPWGDTRASESVHNRFNKTKLSGTNGLRKEGPIISQHVPKRNNIVSNITSFVPLIQQKQAPAIITGKRDIKVKALETAEAARRLQEKKENERKKKKEDMKFERAKLVQENRRQLERQQKKKEEEQKKKEAEMAARKRQRGEEERKEKERKRKRVEEARKQQQEHEEKLRARKDEKETKCQTTDEMEHGRNQPQDEAGNEKKIKKMTRDENIEKLSEIEPRTSTSHAAKESIIAEDRVGSNSHDLEVMNNRAKQNEHLFIRTSQEQSYDVSPYKSSDDEDEDEEDDIPNTKFIPSWASKNRLAAAVSSQKRFDPEAVFPPESFCSMTEVLLPRIHQLR